jgi:hypothetical protein
MRLVAAAVGVGVGAAVLASFPTMGMLELIQLGVVVRMASSVLGWHQVVGTSWRPKAIRRKLKYELDYWFSTDPGAKVRLQIGYIIGATLQLPLLRWSQQSLTPALGTCLNPASSFCSSAASECCL